MKITRKLLKYLLYILLLVIVMLVLFILFISPIAKWAIEKYDKEHTGREITIGKLSLSVFKGELILNDFTVFEQDAKTKFFNAGQFAAKISVTSLFKQKYNVEYVTLSDFYVTIKQKGSHFNFDDLMNLGASDSAQKPEPVDPNTPPTEWFLNNLNLKNGKIVYNDKLIGSEINLSRFNVYLPKFAYNTNNLNVLSDFLINESGRVDTRLNLNLKNLDYTLRTKVNNLDIKPFYVYVKEFLLAKQLNGLINTDMSVKGSFANASDIALKGKLNFNSFLLTDVLNDKLSSFKNLDVVIDSINLKENIFKMNTVALNDLYLKVELYENGTNFNRLMKAADGQTTTVASNASSNSTQNTSSSGASSSNIFLMIADYVQLVAKDYILNSYSADKVDLKNLEIDYSDFTLGEQFYVNMDSLNISSSRISSANNRITANLNSRLNRKGKLNIDISANPKDFLEMDFKTEVKKLPISVFNPYVKYYLAHTFTKGDLNLLIGTSISASHQLTSDNALLVEKIKCGKKIKNIKTAANIPLKLGVALLRDPKGNIDFKFPVKGNLKDPNYKIGKIILKIFENLLVKAVMSPFNAVGALFSKKEPATDFEFDYLQTDFTQKTQRKVLEKTAEFLSEKPELTIQFIQNVNPEKELELLAYRMAKQKYIADPANAALIKGDELTNGDKIDNKDSLFVSYVNNQNKELASQTSHLDKCKRFIGENELTKEHERLITERENQIKSILWEKGIDNKRIIFVRNIDRKQNLNEVKPSFSFDMDSEE